MIIQNKSATNNKKSVTNTQCVMIFLSKFEQTFKRRQTKIISDKIRKTQQKMKPSVWKKRT